MSSIRRFFLGDWFRVLSGMEQWSRNIWRCWTGRYMDMMMAFDYLDSLRTIEIRIQIKTRQAQHLRDTT